MSAWFLDSELSTCFTSDQSKVLDHYNRILPNRSSFVTITNIYYINNNIT